MFSCATLSPPGCEPVEFAGAVGRQIVVKIALQIHGAHVDDQVHALDGNKLLDDDEREIAEIEWIKKREVKPIRIQRTQDLIYLHFGRTAQCADIGSALAQGLDRALLDRLLALTRRFQADLTTLSDEHLRNLSELVDEALETVTHASLRTRQP